MAQKFDGGSFMNLMKVACKNRAHLHVKFACILLNSNYKLLTNNCINQYPQPFLYVTGPAKINHVSTKNH